MPSPSSLDLIRGMVEAAICFSPLRVGGRVGLSAQWIDHLFKVACSGPGVSHIRSFLATSDTLSMVPLYEIAITDRLASTAASYLLSCFTVTLPVMYTDLVCYDLMPL